MEKYDDNIRAVCETEVQVWVRHFWSRGYYISTVGGNKQAVQRYIQNQEKEDMITTKISMVEYYDSFKAWMESYRNGKVNKK